METICQECKPGYKKDSKGECIRCGGEGCAVCGPSIEKCLMCNKGYYMNGDSKCTSKAAGPVAFQE